MFKIGTDIVKISRMEKSLESKRFTETVFSEKEAEYCKTAESFAGLFAAKEAYFKALGSGISKRLCELQILHNESGKPYISGVAKSDVSISHDGEYAIATVILWE